MIKEEHNEIRENAINTCTSRRYQIKNYQGNVDQVNKMIQNHQPRSTHENIQRERVSRSEDRCLHECLCIAKDTRAKEKEMLKELNAKHWTIVDKKEKEMKEQIAARELQLNLQRTLYEEKMSKLVKTVEILEQEITQLRENVKHYEQDNVMLHCQVKDVTRMREEMVRMEEYVITIKQEAKELRTKIEILQEANQDLLNQLREKGIHLQQEIEELRRENCKYKQDKCAAENAVARQQAHLDDLKNSLERAHKELARCHVDSEQLVAKEKEIRRLLEKLKKTEAELREESAKVRQEREIRQRLEEKVKHLEGQLTAERVNCKAAAKQTAEYKSKMEHFQKQVETQKMEIERITTFCREIKVSMDVALHEKETEIRHLREELDRANKFCNCQASAIDLETELQEYKTIIEREGEARTNLGYSREESGKDLGSCSSSSSSSSSEAESNTGTIKRRDQEGSEKTCGLSRIASTARRTSGDRNLTSGDRNLTSSLTSADRNLSSSLTSVNQMSSSSRQLQTTRTVRQESRMTAKSRMTAVALASSHHKQIEE